jgi:hypothetical protein
MTLIIGLGNTEYMLQVSDRRLTSDGLTVDEESCKGASFICENGRFVFGFTGLAQVGGLIIRRWIMDRLLESGPPEFTAKNILHRFTVRASHDFCTGAPFSKLAASDKRLSIMFLGYLYHHEPPMAAYAIITNYQDFTTGRDSPEAWTDFRDYYWNEKRPYKGEISLVQRIGVWQAMPEYRVPQFRCLLEEGKPFQALVGKAVEFLRQVSDERVSKGTVGKQISWIVVYRDPTRGIQSGYESAKNVHQVWMPGGCTVTQKASFAFDDISLAAVDPITTRPMAVPKVHRNAPCPCGSGKKYRKCHGRSSDRARPK